MVRALLAGTKTQTRRVCKSADVIEAAEREPWGEPVLERTATRTGPASIGRRLVGSMCRTQDGFRLADAIAAFCPYGLPGDLLWVRETWRWYSEGIAHYAADNTLRPNQRDQALATFLEHRSPLPADCHTWRPSIHMPRKVSRLTLEITDVRVQRVQEISREDEIAEGTPAGTYYDSVWSSIHGDASWDANPWVWALTFRVHRDNVESVKP
jgi:hypothetical protein